MALTATEAEPIRSAKRFGYAIKMMSGGQIVPVIVTDEALYYGGPRYYGAPYRRGYYYPY